ncbi:oligosaccharide flippase family protein [Brachybacterium sp. MASK1Z-5]|uniref:Oligosaccharide flippase family protein n=1 Tax=Brachybacterium halotolerans TaxID=2795215 RepID=A0ABS1BEE8_9MICO|nr:oligosaccharide flippase family protein [Brachybacterium halotolerans]MBK0332476.1 oligosaccharide flippase family protein [Brachybacterium halotolerans]MBK0333000.1 oligosaccharide flippase family protein [Brachybacterium halotolerans]
MPEQADPPGRGKPDSAKRVSTDVLAIGLGYLASFAYPLVSLPYLGRVMGASELGHLMFALAVLQIVKSVVDFGFDQSSLRSIAVSASTAERSRVAAETLAAKLLIWTACTLVLMSTVLIVPGLRERWLMYAVGLLLIGLGEMYPSWFLQGTGRVKEFALLTAVSRLISLGLLLLTVNSADDMVLAMLWQQFPFALSALVGWFMLRVVWKEAHWVVPRWAGVSGTIRDSWPLFISSVAFLLMSTVNTVVLGVLSTSRQVAFFGAGERFSNAARGVMYGVTGAMLPRMTREDAGARSIQRLISTGIVLAYTCAGIMLIVASPWFVPWYLGEGFDPTITVMQLMGIALLPVGLSSMLALRATANHRFRDVGRISMTGALLHLALLIPASWLWGAVGASAALIASEVLLAALYIRDLVQRRRAAASAVPAPDPEEDPS